MGNLSDKICKENQNTELMFNFFFPKTVMFMRTYSTISYSQTGHRW